MNLYFPFNGLRVPFLWLILLHWALPGSPAFAAPHSTALVLINRASPDSLEFEKFLQPYLRQFGVPYEVLDISERSFPEHSSDYSLIIVGHRGFDPARRFFSREEEELLLAAIEKGTGLISLDGLLATWRGENPSAIYAYSQRIFDCSFRRGVMARSLIIGPPAIQSPTAATHYITSASPVPREIPLKKGIVPPGLVPGPRSQVLALAGENPWLITSTFGRGRAMLMTSCEWAEPTVKGRIHGLDDLVWRSLVWAARKPFVLRGMPHFLAFRVDDVSGFGKGKNQHLGWVETANRHGLKPWLGVFIDDLRQDPVALETLSKLTLAGQATAFPHARTWRKFLYLDEPLLNDEAGRNIAGKPWPDETMAANFQEAEAFFQENQILKSKVAIPHFYQFGLNNFEGLLQWGAEFTGTVLVPGQGYGTPMPAAGPYLIREPPRPSNAPDPVLISSWLEVPGHPEYDRRFFNFDLEIRDVAGYEWAPSGVPVEEAVRRGVEESKRAWDSLLPAVLFTHESDHLQHLPTEDWEEILKGVMEQLASYQPIPVTLDFLCQYMRAVHTSSPIATSLDPAKEEQGTITFEGQSDIELTCYLFSEREGVITTRAFTVSPFSGRTVFSW